MSKKQPNPLPPRGVRPPPPPPPPPRVIQEDILPTKPWPRTISPTTECPPGSVDQPVKRGRKLLATLTLWAIATGITAAVKFNPDIPFLITLAVCSVVVALSIAVTSALVWAIRTLTE